MDISIADGVCVVDRDGLIVWAAPEFVELFAHRASVIGTRFNQLFSGLIEVCRPGEIIEDRDRVGRKRYFQVECRRLSDVRGDHVSDVVVMRNVTLMVTANAIARLATQTRTPKDLLEKALWVVKETYGYLGLAGFVARENTIELVASKGWTEKLKSMISTVPVAPDAPAMAGRCAYHRRQMVTTIEEYGLMPTVKDAIERIGGEFVVVTPLIDHDRLVGVLTVIHGRALSPAELDTLQAVCGQIAVALNVRLEEEELSTRAEDAALFVDLLAHELEENAAVIEAGQNSSKALASNGEIVAAVRAAATAGLRAPLTIPLGDAVGEALVDGEMIARRYGRRLNAKYKKPVQEPLVGPLFRYALRLIVSYGLKTATADAVDVEIKVSRDRLGTSKIEIADNGPGIPDELKSEIFRRGAPDFSLAKKIVGRNGGRVWIEDRVPGNSARGARVVITLPESGPGK